MNSFSDCIDFDLDAGHSVVSKNFFDAVRSGADAVFKQQNIPQEFADRIVNFLETNAGRQVIVLLTRGLVDQTTANNPRFQKLLQALDGVDNA